MRMRLRRYLMHLDIRDSRCETVHFMEHSLESRRYIYQCHGFSKIPVELKKGDRDTWVHQGRNAWQDPSISSTLVLNPAREKKKKGKSRYSEQNKEGCREGGVFFLLFPFFIYIYLYLFF